MSKKYTTPQLAVFNQHVNDAEKTAMKVIKPMLSEEAYAELEALQESGIMAIFDQEPDFHTGGYVALVTAIVNGDLVVPPKKAKK